MAAEERERANTYAGQCLVGDDLAIDPVDDLKLESGQRGGEGHGIEFISSGWQIDHVDFLKLGPSQPLHSPQILHD